MTGEDVEDKLEHCSLAIGSSLPNINRIWDLRRLLKSSQESLEKLKRTSLSDNESMQLERAIIRGVSKEIERLEREILCPDEL